MKKPIHFFMVMLLALAAQAFFTSCNSDISSDPAPTYYTVTFYKNYKGAEPATHSDYYKAGNSATLSSESRKGYKFLGWAKKADAAAPEYHAGDSIKVESNLSFYALWKKVDSFKVTFDAGFIKDGDSAAETKTQNVTVSSSSEKFLLDKNTFTRDGYVFAGWSKTKTSSYDSYKIAYKDAENVEYFYEDTTLYALWLEQSKSIKITYNKNDGTATPEETSQYVKYGSKPSYSYYGNGTNYNKLKPNTFTRENYEFLGWSNSSYATSATYEDAEKDVYFTANTPLYAVWQYKGPVVISFDGNGGKDSDGNTTATQTITANTYTELKANTFAKENYGFAGWAKTNTATYRDYSDKQSVKFSEPTVTLYAMWQPNPVITFNGNGGTTSGGETTATQSIPYGVSTALNENPFTKAGSTFLGWNKSASGTYAQYSDKESISIYGDTTLYAIWKDDIVLTFNANGGVGSDITKNVAYDKTSSSYKFTVPENTFTKTGYVFIGWGNSASSKDVSYKAGESASASESKTLYAIWAKESVTVTFDPNTENGGSGTAFTQNLSLNTTTLKYEATLPINTFTNSNGNFVGWCRYKKPDSSYKIKEIMSAGLAVSLSPSQLPNIEGFTLYAVWNPKTYTVTYKLGGNGTDIVKTVTNTAEYGKRMDYTLEAAPASELSYYSFIGWSNYNGIYPDLSAGQTIQLDEDETIYAVWKLGVILDTSGTVSSSSHVSFPFKLLNETRLVFTATASGSNGLDFWLYDSENTKISNKTKLTSETYTLNLSAGTYELIINNANWVNTKSYTIKIEPAN